ncbi:VCBS repeat-containing protein [Hyunsoonleella pacifica]|uniref:ASPIC/UnbV domain-containing protein n=1 Tax=Hyunsoonleella pacifica TaxID=1080224 RepID=A0A4Q9FS91_9FLAO|nr:VCBS repeat-containing protein [Hyunsoonleella pacifica]TBN16587.1 hypothetical protein EYD46_08105 [Hyunsoonleella pacifica]GGD18178.1 hypothetical protein GCM10011368_20120 [Hyunsoonleella pacifica]
MTKYNLHFTSICTVFLILIVLIGCKKEEKQVNVKQEPLFKSLDAKQTGVYFNNHITEDANNFFIVYNYAYNGGGVAIGDINNDGLSDIFFTGNQVANKLYLNKGNFKFEDITTSAGITNKKGWDNGVVMADVNGDNFLDIYVCRGGRKDTDAARTNLLYINNKDNTFTEQAKAYNIADKGYSMMASFFDMDNDNDLDLYVTNRPRKFFLSHDAIAKGKKEQSDLHRDKLYENVNGSFKEIGLKAGINNTFAYGLGLATSDINNDGFSDIYVANDYFESDYFFQNKGNKTFSQNIQSFSNHVAFYGMGIDVVDFNNDGLEDLIELDMTSSDHIRAKTTMATMDVGAYKRILEKGNHHQYMHNMLQINNGNGFFSEVAQYAGIDKTDWSWSCLGSDFDNDGLRDIFITNGFRRDIFDKDASAKFSKYINSKEKKQRSKNENVTHIVNLFNENKIHNYIYKNEGNLKFTDKIEAWGLEQISLSNGAAVGDLDNDGDLDLVVNNINDAAFIYRNDAEKLEHNFLKIKLEGPLHNGSGLGAKITVYTKEGIQYHELKNVRGYLSSVEPIAHFGLGKTNNIDSVKVIWPDKKTSLSTNIGINTHQIINYNTATHKTQKVNKPKAPIFKDITSSAFPKHAFTHKENTFDDFEQQILLPHKLSTEGPCITVADINNDGYEDFFVGGATNQSGAIYVQKANNTFYPTSQTAILKDKIHEDTAATFFDANDDGYPDLYVVSGGNEFNENSKNYHDRLYINNGYGRFIKSKNLPNINSSGGCVIPLDYDEDGDLDLFVGGRLTPNRYPNTPKSFLLQNNNGTFKDVTVSHGKALEEVGMVTDAVWTDIDGDSKNELFIVGEWMPISAFHFKNGVFQDKNLPSLNKTNGWWNAITAKDIDADGDIDLVLGNLGENYKFKASEKKPFYVFASDYDNNGTNDVFLAKNYKDKIVPIRGKECSSQQLPIISKKFKTYNEFARADLGTILNDKTLTSEKHKAYIFRSIMLINNNGTLQAQNLPYQAQYSTVQSIVLDDFSNNDYIDIVLAGNKFNVEIETTRADASIGMLFKNENNSTFSALQPQQSGIVLPYNVKTLKKITLGPVNGKNSKGVLVGINDAQIKLLKNQP